MNQTLKKVFFFLALQGFVAAVTINAFSYADIDAMNVFPPSFLLHFGIFVVFLPAILELKSRDSIKEYEKQNFFKKLGGRGYIKAAFENAPIWLKIAATASFIYPAFCFMLFPPGGRAIFDSITGHYLLNRGTSTERIISLQEYQHLEALTTRGFSGTWMAFYCFSMAVLYPFQTKKESSDEMELFLQSQRGKNARN